MNKNNKMNYHKLREWLSEQEHIQWVYWSKTLAKELHTIQALINRDENDKASHIILNRLLRWKINWKPYKKLKSDVKDYDREWADKILDELPFKCPIHQCGGWMVTKERGYPKGMTEDDFPDGMPGDTQLPDLVCTNCGAIYHFEKFKSTRKYKKRIN